MSILQTLFGGVVAVLALHWVLGRAGLPNYWRGVISAAIPTTASVNTSATTSTITAAARTPARPGKAADPTQLQQHLRHCMAAASRLHRLRGAAEAIDAFLSPRFVSTLLVLALTAAALTWLAV